MRVRDLRGGFEREVPASTPSVPTFVLDYVARSLAHAGGDATLQADEARAFGPVPLSTFSPGDEVFLESPAGPWRLVAVIAAPRATWRLLPCGASLLMAGACPLRVTDGVADARAGAEGKRGRTSRILAEAEAATGLRLALGPWTPRRRNRRSAALTVL
ncbi:MAG: hypothetical protein R3A48_22870 [Polyangiales bacterium]